ncbi:hypothetical protein NAI76_09365, partial [Francisella tularensis subsp. holarctica]|nr:hypothetical protein [Francisella tularensis subsp. holarctica]
APALATANLGIAMAAIGNYIAIEIADLALMSDDNAKLPWLIKQENIINNKTKYKSYYSYKSYFYIFSCVLFSYLMDGDSC